MARVLKQFAVLGVVTSALAACHSLDIASIKNVKETPQSQSNALIYCEGTENCEFERLDQIPVLDAKTRRLGKQALKQQIVRLQAESLKEPNALYLSVPAGQHELVVRFYPISHDKAETLHVIHSFNPHKRYILKMFRHRTSKHKQGSLLNASAPDPLCVDLQQDRKTIRRFCKPYNVLNGLGEFVEQKNFKFR